MLCEKCQQQQATVHMQQLMNGEKTEMHLCASCAEEMEMPILSFDNFFQSFLESMFTGHKPQMAESPPAQAQCASCGLTYSDFRNTVRIGCADCYNAFRSELGKVIKNMQGSNQHQGKFPKRFGARLAAKRQLERLRSQLTQAIEKEEYEEAARLRDQIRGLKEGDSNEQMV
ncbi:MAG: UvrB/UvrC motif-containing protein [Clostridiales bacterium]|jgi:protein arginine kinase activator|nr:UvrB/UvrC motif-containing protein [Clostridiales bacterium]